jgi:DNA-binding response OmpR family regulator
MTEGDGMKILMIEDEYLVAEEIRLCLEDAGFSGVEHAATEDDALKHISDAGWDAAVVDANLDGRSIEAVADALFERGIPFVIVTGYARESLPERLGGITVVEKPFRPKTLVDAVSSLFPR